MEAGWVAGLTYPALDLACQAMQGVSGCVDVPMQALRGDGQEAAQPCRGCPVSVPGEVLQQRPHMVVRVVVPLLQMAVCWLLQAGLRVVAAGKHSCGGVGRGARNRGSHDGVALCSRRKYLARHIWRQHLPCNAELPGQLAGPWWACRASGATGLCTSRELIPGKTG